MIRLPGKVNSNSHGARPVHQIILMIKWTQTSKWPIKNSHCIELSIKNSHFILCNPVKIGFGGWEVAGRDLEARLLCESPEPPCLERCADACGGFGI